MRTEEHLSATDRADAAIVPLVWSVGFGAVIAYNHGLGWRSFLLLVGSILSAAVIAQVAVQLAAVRELRPRKRSKASLALLVPSALAVFLMVHEGLYVGTRGLVSARWGDLIFAAISLLAGLRLNLAVFRLEALIPQRER